MKVTTSVPGRPPWLRSVLTSSHSIAIARSAPAAWMTTVRSRVPWRTERTKAHPTSSTPPRNTAQPSSVGGISWPRKWDRSEPLNRTLKFWRPTKVNSMEPPETDTREVAMTSDATSGKTARPRTTRSAGHRKMFRATRGLFHSGLRCGERSEAP
jgi:hypothetical protein